ncbi:MAG: type I pullulanase [Bacilli bacterium]|jgi:pullulanase|nr:type I pullulanase [Bacilli bacterium]
MKKILLIISAFFLFLTPAILKADTPVVTLKVHYFRYNADYTDGWDFWIWQKTPTNKAGTAYKFDIDENEKIILDDFGAVATIDLTADALKDSTTIGIIVRKGDSWLKDVSTDRFINIKESSEDGIMHIYLVEADERIGISLDDPNGPDKTDKIRYAYFKDETTIAFALTTIVVPDAIHLEIDGIEPKDYTTTITGINGELTINGSLDFNKSYILKAKLPDGLKTYSITYDGIYDSSAFEEAYGYDGDDLGVVVKKNSTLFRLWAPISTKVVLNLYSTGTPEVNGGTDKPEQSINMVKSIKGTWQISLPSNLHGKYYTYSVTNGLTTNEVIDPYAKSAGVNGLRGLIIDFEKINPEGFTYDKRANNISSPTDAIIYELHVRDLSSHDSWTGPEEYRGKFLGLTVEDTTYEGVTTGFDHIKELGVTHVQLLPIFDFGVIDEADPKNSFNWGYMPINFNVPEGSYSTDPFDGIKRVVELKQTTTAFNNNNIGVIMDVVYNHTGKSADSNFNLILPGYYFRMNEDGSFSNGSGTGNETASERYMMRKFMVDSVVFWATEYNLSGFRFDLMALHDVTTMNLIVQKLHEIDENILIYGEPWNGGTTPIDETIAADKINLVDMPSVGAFNDEIRDGIKGSVFAGTDKGFIQGNIKSEVINKVKYGVVGGVEHPDVTSKGLSYTMFWHTAPTKTINYVSAHDNNTLYDKIILSTTTKQRDLRDDMQKQANAIVLTSQGVVFLHAGVEFMRSKPKVGGGYDENSYESPDSTNQLRWDLKAKEENLACFEHYKGLIALRRAHPAFRMTTAEEIIHNVDFLYEDVEGVLAYTISNYANNDTWGTILIIHNNCNKQLVTLNLPAGTWNLVVNSSKISTTTFKTYEDGATINLFASETVVLYQGERVIASGCSSCASGSIINYVSMSFALFALAFFRRRNFFTINE